jgi:hypothetical protein
VFKKKAARMGQARALYRLGQGGKDPDDKRGQASQAGGPTGGVFKTKILPVRAKRARPTGWGRAGRIPMTKETRIPKPAAQQEAFFLARKGQARAPYRLGQGGKDPDDKRGQGSQAGGPTGGVFKKKIWPSILLLNSTLLYFTLLLYYFILLYSTLLYFTLLL